VAELPDKDLPATALVETFAALPTLDVGVAAQLRAVLALAVADVFDAAFYAVGVHFGEVEDVVAVLLQLGVFKVFGCVAAAAATAPEVALAASDLAKATHLV